MSYVEEIEAELVDGLLELSGRDRREDLLRSVGLLDSEGLNRLLDCADDLLGSDPVKAGRLAEACTELAGAADAPEAVPKANYVLAGVQNINGNFEEDLRLTRAAHDGYAALGMHAEALRTNVGKMAALLELGRYREALDVGESVLDEVRLADSADQPELLIALVNQNRGGCYEYMGLYEEALEAYSSAEELYRSLGQTERVGEVIGNRGAVMLQIGRAKEALSAYETVAGLAGNSGSTISFVKALVNSGEAHLRLGNYRASLDAFERARIPLESLDATADGYLFLRHMADAYLELNLYTEALTGYREAEELLRDAGMIHDRAQALWGMGKALAGLSESEAARDALEEAATLFSLADNSPLLSGVMLEQAELLSRLGSYDEARQRTEAALELIPDEEDLPLQSAQAHLKLHEISLFTGDMSGAEDHLRDALRTSRHLALPQLRYRLDERRGRLRRLQGRTDEAEKSLLSAIEGIENLKDSVRQDSVRASFLQDKTVAYEELLYLYLQRSGDTEEREGIEETKNPGDVLKAFEVSERAKSRALLDLLTGTSESHLPGGSEGDAGSEAGSRLAAAQGELNATYNRIFERAGGDSEAGVALPELNRRAVELEAEIGLIRLRLDATGSDDPDPFQAPGSDEFLTEKIPPGTTLLAYHVLGDEILTFIVSGGEVRVRRRVGSVGRVRELLRKLDSQWDRFRSGQSFSGRQMAMLEKSTNRVLGALYDEVLRPVEQLLPATGRLAIVPHGPLHQAPFHAFFDGERHLLERFEISYAPSTSVFALCQDKESRGTESMVAVGVSDELIPTAREEARTVAGLFAESELLLDERATPESLEAAVPGCGILHLACHGMFRSDNPMFSALKLNEGWLLASDVTKLDLDGATVTLSACESGRNVVVGGDEILGLTRAFLGARAATLLVSLWIVHDHTTAPLMQHFYEALRTGIPPAQALREAQMTTREKHPHPYYWAPFITIGKR